MEAVYACLHEDRVRKLVLLAPALHLDFYNSYRDKKLQIPVTIFHGLLDDVVPLDDIRETAEKLYLNHVFNAMDDDHSLHKTFSSLDWDSLLK